jgi:hypothetical protein
MSDTLHQDPFTFPRPGRTDPNELAEEVAEVLRSFVQKREPILAWEQPNNAHSGQTRVVVRSSGRPGIGVSAEAHRRLTVRCGAGNSVIVADTDGVAYGEGPTFADAMEQWNDAAQEHYQELRQNEARLHPRMQRQLAFLRLIFG